METDRLSYLLRHEATAHGKEDYKHLAADALESLSAEVESLRAELAELRAAIEAMRVAGGAVEFQRAFDEAKIIAARKGEGEK